MEELSPGVRTLLEGRNWCNLATVMKDGSPQVTPMWVDTDGRHVLVNTAVGRVKVGNVERDNRVALSVFDHSDPRRRVLIRGRVVEVTKNGADEHINKLAQKYRGEATYRARRSGEQRIILKILPEHVNSSGVD